MKRIIFTIVWVALLCRMGTAQTMKVRGVVTDADRTPLAGASVSAVNAGGSAVTDAKGRFSLSLTQPDTLAVTYVGYRPIKVAVHPGQNIGSLALEGNANSLDELVVTGYQKERKKDLTGAVSVVDMKQIQNAPVGNPIKALQGEEPGVYITTDGSPSGGATVRIRGIGTLNNNDPLYIIDGMPTERGLQELNPNDIASIQVLKDASSASIYGSRAANGVIIVTTKRAQEGYSRLNFDYSFSLQYYNTRLKPLNTMQRGQAYWQAAVNDHSDPNNNETYQYGWNGDYDNPVLNKIILPDFIDPAKTMKPANTNWFNEIAQTSQIQSYNLSFAKGHKGGSSFFSLGYYDNKGVIKESRSQKVNARFNSDYSFLNGHLKVGENISATYIDNGFIDPGDVLFDALVEQPIVPIHTVDGGWGGPSPGMTDRQNPVRIIEDNKQNHSHFGRVFGNAYADLEVIPNLHLKTSFGADYSGTYDRTLQKSYTSGFLSDPTNTANTSQEHDVDWVWQNTLTYKLASGKSDFDFLLGEEQTKYVTQFFEGSGNGLALENIDYAYLDATTTNKNSGGNGSGYALLSYFGKVNYVYDNKYLASATLRRDGSSRFGKENRFGFFPAFSLGWRLSEEQFIKNISAISDLKLRYGWGETGNQDIANNATYTLYSAIYGTDPTWGPDQGSAYDISGAGTGQLQSGYTLIQTGNDNLKWETTKESNFGVDFGLFENRISGSIDYFIKNTSNILISPGTLAVLGQGSHSTFNGASMQNRGIEVLLSYTGHLSHDISLEVTGNISNYRNKVTYLPDEVLTSYPGNGTTKTILGRSINSTFGYVADGLFTSEKEVDNSPEQPGKGLGRIRYKDLNGDGVIDGDDRDYIGHMDPRYIYGLNVSLAYKRISLSFFIQGVQGIDVYNQYKTYTDFSSLWVGTNWGNRVLDAWTPQNPKSTIPALTLVDANNEGRTSTYYIENGSYLKLRNVQLSYDLKDLLRNVKMQTTQVYLRASNLFTIKSKSYTATDPENPNYAFPIPVMTTIGLNLGF